MALETLWGNRVDVAIARLQSFEPADGYWLAFSGGKDSQVIYHLALAAGVKFEAHYSVTTVDPPELLRFIKAEYPDVIWDRPKKTMWQLIVDHGVPPTRVIRYCCQELKEDKGEGHIVVTGVRWQESGARSKRGMVEGCTKGHKSYVHPIIDWSADDVWQYHAWLGIPHCQLYDEGWKRIGCVLCPMNRNNERDMARWPRIAANYLRACERVYQRRAARGDKMMWTSGDNMFDWWIANGRGNIGDDSDQMSLFA